MTDRIDQSSQTIRADADTIFEALMNPDELVQWLPPAGMTARLQRFDPSVGGGYRMELVYRDPRGQRGKTRANADVVDVQFTALEPGRRIEQLVSFDSPDPAFAGEMRMVWELCAEGGLTHVSIRCENVPRGISPQDHAAGLASSLENLAAFVEASD